MNQNAITSAVQMQVSPAATPYDKISYDGHAFVQTHPDRLSTLAALHGMRPADIAHCRVLELGCGSGANLIPMAYELPRSEFVGIDLSEQAIAKAARQLARLGLRNIRLLRADISSLAEDLGSFDYIICHGVYSWVHSEAREKILDLFGKHLAEQGIAYVSYNCLPGSHLRNIGRDIMQFHVRGIEDPVTKVDQARAILKYLSDVGAKEQVYGYILREQFGRVQKMPDEVLYHDDLDPVSRPFHVYEVVEAAERRGLQYLSEATFSDFDLKGYPSSIVRMLQQIPESEVVAREQYLDFIEGRTFRETLLCRNSIELRQKVEASALHDFFIAGAMRPAAADIDLRPGIPIEFTPERGRAIATADAVAKAGFLLLWKMWPQAVAFDVLVQEAVDTITSACGQLKGSWEEHSRSFAAALLQAFADEAIEVHRHPPRLTTLIGEKPEASLVARLQAAEGSLVTNLRHGTVMLTDELVRSFLQLLDGTRDIEQLFVDLRSALASRPELTATTANSRDYPHGITREAVEDNLRRVARLGLLPRLVAGEPR